MAAQDAFAVHHCAVVVPLLQLAVLQPLPLDIGILVTSHWFSRFRISHLLACVLLFHCCPTSDSLIETTVYGLAFPMVIIGLLIYFSCTSPAHQADESMVVKARGKKADHAEHGQTVNSPA